MATETEVKQYIACWFQLAKKVVIGNGTQSLLPNPIFQGDRYSDEFEECWQKVTSPEAGDSYLEGTDHTIAQLLTHSWEIIPCARCHMPAALPHVGISSNICPCHDLPNWPNTELPAPRSLIDSQNHLKGICDRLSEN
jgi:hypothetical protein